MSRSFDPSLPSTSTNFDDASKKVDGTDCATTAAPEELGRVFTTSTDAGRSWHLLWQHRWQGAVAASMGTTTAANSTPSQHRLETRHLLQPWPPCASKEH
jgi:hypothetical protein